ncbi:GlcNAc-transferase family protein [Paraburkholderia aspalathi]|uniref:GlcNAc-transferase family protein n=1 Tax=Paraburkholderia aspalathi TaxID=1324617 RepID=UPI0038B8F786
MSGIIDSDANTIFVQIASYRDPQLLPTLRDLIYKASKPCRLRIVVSWQHASDEPVEDFLAQGFIRMPTERFGNWIVQHLHLCSAKVELIDIAHMKSQGTCWARNLLQQRYDGERYTLQLDSHHRFIKDWDVILVDMLESLRSESPKPVLTSCPCNYEIDNDTALSGDPPCVGFGAFLPSGVVIFDNMTQPVEQFSKGRPVRARFYNASFTFADGHFATTVQHDPNYFFWGEEISISVRAFTHGYDLYHPHRVITWHAYSHHYRVMMTDDHSIAAKERGEIELHWEEREQISFQRNRELLGIDGTIPSHHDFGEYGLGRSRTLQDFETFAGLDFARRAVHETLLNHGIVPPQPPGAPRPDQTTWDLSLRHPNELRIHLRPESLIESATLQDSPGLFDSARSAVVTVRERNAARAVLHRELFNASRLSQHYRDGRLDLFCKFSSPLGHLPGSYSVELFDVDDTLLGAVERTIPP